MSRFRMKSFESTDKNYRFLFECDDKMIHDYRVVLSGKNGNNHQFISSNGNEFLLMFEKDRTIEGENYYLQILEFGKVIYTKQIYLKTKVFNNIPVITEKREEPKKEMVEKKEEKRTFDMMVDEMDIIKKVKMLFEVEEI